MDTPAFGGGASTLNRDNAAHAREAKSNGRPLLTDLVARLDESNHLSATDRAALASEVVYKVRGQSTLRHTVMALYDALVNLQAQNSAPIVKRLERNRASTIQTIVRGGGALVASTTMSSQLSSRAARRLETVGT